MDYTFKQVMNTKANGKVGLVNTLQRAPTPSEEAELSRDKSLLTA